MSKVTLFAHLMVFSAMGVVIMGCSQQQAATQPAPSPEVSQNHPGAASHQDNEHGEASATVHVGHSEYEAALAELPAADRVLAEKQKVCPVSGEPLGAMGKPYKVTVQGQDVLLCCSGCEAKIKANPEEYLAKLKQE